MRTHQPHPSTDLANTHRAPQNRLDPLLVLRGLACLMVTTIHCNPQRKSILFHDLDLSWLWFSNGLVAVWIFFCLSGYLMGKAFYTGRYRLTRQGVFTFWRNRALRILPLYYFVVFMLAVLVYPDILRFENWGHLVHIITFTYPGILQPALLFDIVLWSLSTEIQFYLIVPFIYAGLRRLQQSKLTVLTTMGLSILTVFAIKLLIWLPLRNEITNDMYYAFRYWYTPLINNLDLFLVGFLVNPLIQIQQSVTPEAPSPWYKKFKLPTHTSLAIATTLLIALYLFSAHHFYSQELFGLPGRPGGYRTTTTIFALQPITAIVIAFFIWAFESSTYSIKRSPLSFETILENPLRATEILGHLSYGIYLWHFPIYWQIVPLISTKVPIESFYISLTLTLILSTIMAALTYYLVERPANRWKIL
jgi:peptidoglycan/LPS O-acetylase OafA/YrhL